MAPAAITADFATVPLAQRDTVVTVTSIIPPVATATASANPTAKKAAIGPIVGGLIGGVVAGVSLAALIIWCVYKRKKRSKEAKEMRERRQRRLAAQRRAKQDNNKSMVSLASSGARLNGTAYSEKNLGFDPNVPVAAPQRPPRSQQLVPQQYDPFASDHGYGYESRPDRASASSYVVQQTYDQPSVASESTSLSSRRVSPPSSTSASSDSSRSSRSSTRAAAADKAAMSAGQPVASRHRPSRPSPLAQPSSSDYYATGASIDFGAAQPGVSPTGSIDSSRNSRTSPSPQFEAYADASNDAWGIALGDPVNDRTPPHAPHNHKHSSSQYSSDPFAEYHIYENGVMGYDEETIRAMEPDVDVSSPQSQRR